MLPHGEFYAVVIKTDSESRFDRTYRYLYKAQNYLDRYNSKGDAQGQVWLHTQDSKPELVWTCLL